MRTIYGLAAAAALFASAPAGAETLLFTSRFGCQPGDGSCFYTFNASEPMPLWLDNVVVNAPRAGVATVVLNGTMQCEYPSFTQGDVGVVDLTAVISKGKDAPPFGGRGSARFAMRIPPISGSGPLPSLSYAVNLASTQMFEVKKGKTEFRYWFNRNRMDANTKCTVFDVTMSATFAD